MDMDIKRTVQRGRYISRKEMTLFQEINNQVVVVVEDF